MKVHASCPPAATSTTYRPEFLSLRHEIEHVDAPRGWAEAFFFIWISHFQKLILEIFKALQFWTQGREIENTIPPHRWEEYFFADFRNDLNYIK